MIPNLVTAVSELKGYYIRTTESTLFGYYIGTSKSGAMFGLM